MHREYDIGDEIILVTSADYRFFVIGENGWKDLYGRSLIGEATEELDDFLKQFVIIRR